MQPRGSHDTSPATAPKHQPIQPAAPTSSAQQSASIAPACPVCGGRLVEIRHKLTCSRCHAICETCCEGGRG